MITFPFWDVESVSRPQLLSDDFNIRLPSSEWSSSEVKISRHDTSSSSRSGCEDIFINKQLTGHSHAFTASLPLRGIEWTWTGKWGTGQREATGEQGSERRAQCENCCMKFKVSSGQMHFLFCVMTRLLVQRYLKCLMPRYSPILHLTSQQSDIQHVHLRVINTRLLRLLTNIQRAASLWRIFTLTISSFNLA